MPIVIEKIPTVRIESDQAQNQYEQEHVVFKTNTEGAVREDVGAKSQTFSSVEINKIIVTILTYTIETYATLSRQMAT